MFCISLIMWFLCVCVYFQVDLMKNISNIPQPFLYTRHVHFLNFTRCSKHMNSPVWFISYVGSYGQTVLTYISSFASVRFRIEQPVYINIIRDPINRFLSNYFFRRFGDWRGEQNHLIRTPGMKDDERYLVRPLSSSNTSLLSPSYDRSGLFCREEVFFIWQNHVEIQHKIFNTQFQRMRYRDMDDKSCLVL